MVGNIGVPRKREAKDARGSVSRTLEPRGISNRSGLFRSGDTQSYQYLDE